MSTPHILMCPPVNYGIEYEINPWMSTARQVDHGLAMRQWSDLRDILESTGAVTSEVEPVAGVPDMVFTANAGLIYGERAIVAHFKHPQRQGEEPYFRAWFESHGWQTSYPPGGMFFEGAGDALFCGDSLFAGYRMRSDARGHQQIGASLGVRVLPIELIDPYYYHLDTCFCPLAPDEAIYYPAALDNYGQQVLVEYIPHLHVVEEAEAQKFACNAVVVGKTVVTNVGCPRLHQLLRTLGYDPIETPLSEFVKAGGSAKCLTLRLDGEEAAGWKR